MTTDATTEPEPLTVDAGAAPPEPKRKAADDPPPDMLTSRLVYCDDGPRAGAWYFLDHGPGSWLELRRLARLNGETEHTGRTLGYVATQPALYETHRTWPDISAHVLLWAPDLAAEAREKQLAGQRPTPAADPAEHARQRTRAAARGARQ